jgi:hypothetical protein
MVLKIITLLLISLVIEAFAIAGTWLVTMPILRSIVNYFGSITFLIIFTPVLIALIIFLLPALWGTHNKKSIQIDSPFWDERIKWALERLVKTAGAMIFLLLFMVICKVSEEFNPNLSLFLIIFFLTAIFAKAYVEDRKIKRLARSGAAWWT